MLEERAYWLAWSQVNRVGPVLLLRLQNQFGTLANAWNASGADLQKVQGFGNQIVKAVIESRTQINPEQLLEEHSQKNPNFWTLADADYPRLLKEIPSPPPILYYRGLVESKENLAIKPTIGIVGTRYPTEYGRLWTRKISTTLAKHGFTVVSGMAKGIDAEAHRSCLEAGGRTIAVVGTGVDIVYPWENRTLYEQIQKQGLVVSEYSAGTQPNASHFPQRNRIIAGLSRAILIMEAPSKSGALITAYQANEFCRDVYVLPGRLDDERSEGCLELISKGAQIILKDERQLLELLGEIPQLDTVEQLSLFPPEKLKPAPQLQPELAEIFQTLTAEATPFDVIVQQSGKSAGEVSSALLQLELLGLVSQLPGMQYKKC